MILSDKGIRAALARTGEPAEPHHNSIWTDPLSTWFESRPLQPLVIDPLDESRIQPASIDLTLDVEFLIPQSSEYWSPVDLDDVKNTLAKEPPTPVAILPNEGFNLHPQEFCLASTHEYVSIPDDLAARVEGKSSLGRIGLFIHITAGYIDPGFKGKITLEMVNVSPRSITLRPGRAICQLSLLQLSSRAEKPYGHEDLQSKYQDQKSVTGSRYKDSRA